MKSLCALWVFVGLTLLLPAVWVSANPIPDFSNCHYACATSQQVSVYTRPDGLGDPLADCYLYGGQKTDATITLWVIDSEGNPVTDFPPEDMWLETESQANGPVICSDLFVADHATDVNGMTTFSQSFAAGGASTGIEDRVIVWILGYPLTHQESLPLLFNSPDINRDLVVNLSDVVHFVGYFTGSYDYRCDYHWDGQLNLSDVVLLGQAVGTGCP
jgi:hypothetical protein